MICFLNKSVGYVWVSVSQSSTGLDRSNDRFLDQDRTGHDHGTVYVPARLIPVSMTRVNVNDN